jgi:hypothetical protein
VIDPDASIVVCHSEKELAAHGNLHPPHPGVTGIDHLTRTTATGAHRQRPDAAEHR